MSVMTDDFDRDDEFVVVDDLVAVDEFGDPVAEAVVTETHTYDSDGQPVVEYDLEYVDEAGE